jgi:hypothetical protein
VSGEVEDDCGINSVHAEVASGEGFYSYFELHPVGPGSFVTAILYEGEVQLPPNFQEGAVGYQAIEAEDTTARSNTPSLEKRKLRGSRSSTKRRSSPIPSCDPVSCPRRGDR